MNQGNVVEIMYSDLYKGINLRSEDLTAYESPLISFEGKTVISRGKLSFRKARLDYLYKPIQR